MSLTLRIPAASNARDWARPGPVLRLALPYDPAWEARPPAARPAVAAPPTTETAAADYEDAERWDGLA